MPRYEHEMGDNKIILTLIVLCARCSSKDLICVNVSGPQCNPMKQVCTVITPTLQMKKLVHRQVE